MRWIRFSQRAPLSLEDAARFSLLDDFLKESIIIWLSAIPLFSFFQ
jgi:hypothetical protein